MFWVYVAEYLARRQKYEYRCFEGRDCRRRGMRHEDIQRSSWILNLWDWAFGKKTDVEHGFAVDTPVSRRRVNTVFAEDIALCMSDCQRWVKGFDDLPEEVQHILCNMMFNMGFTRMSKFRKLKANIEKKNWSGASEEMKSSKWYTQVTNRAERLVQKNESGRRVKCYQQY